MDFYIKKESTLPELKFPLTQNLMEKYDITERMLDNVVITFSMIDIETGKFKIANVAADIIVNSDRPNYPDECKYTLVYRFKLKQTKKVGRYIGEFKLDFLGDACGKLTLPIDSQINIHINENITRTTVI